MHLVALLFFFDATPQVSALSFVFPVQLLEFSAGICVCSLSDVQIFQ